MKSQTPLRHLFNTRMLPVMAVVSLQSLELDTSVVFAITSTTVKSAKRDSTMSIHSSKFKDQVMLQRPSSLLLMMINQLNKKYLKLSKKKNTTIITVMDMDMVTVMDTVITIIEVEEVDGDNTVKVLPKTKNGNKLLVTGLIWQKSISMEWELKSKKKQQKRMLAGDSVKKDLSGHKLEQLS